MEKLMIKYTSILVVALVFFSGCNVFDNEQSEVIVNISEESFSIYNATNQTIWFAAFRTDDLPFINYELVSGDENKVEKGKIREYSGDNLYGGFISGDNITVFYWSTTNPNDDNIKNIKVDVK